MSLETWWAWMLPPTPILIEDAVPADAGELAALHEASFSHDWSEHDIAALLREPNVISFVARRANALGSRAAIGFLMLRVAADEAEVLTIAVDPRQRGRGCGRRLLEAGLRRLYHDRVQSIFLEVDASNEAALKLYHNLAFRQVGERRGYYNDGSAQGATALVMRADLGPRTRR